jgi:flagellar assembly protein FliH
MSCRLLRAEDAGAPAAHPWSPARIPGISGAGAGGGREEESFPGDPIPGDLAAEVEKRVQAAYQKGVAAGEAGALKKASEQASLQAAQRTEPVIARLSQMIQELAGLRPRFRHEAEADTVKLAIAIGRRVLYRELATDPEAILGLVMAAYQKLNARETHRLRVSPADAAVLQEHRARLELPPALEIQGDASVGPGSAVFDTSRGEMEASVNTQLAEIERGLADVARRRAR